MILSIDTTSEFGSIALTGDGETVEEVLLHSPDGFGHILHVQIQWLLARHRLDVQNLDCLASATGPGSFTGVRVGLAAAKGLAEAAGKPLVGVSNLRAIAAFGSAPLRATVLDARRGEVYGALYDDQLALVREEVVMKFPEWLASLAPAGYEFIAVNFDPFRAHVDPLIPVITAPRAIAGAVGLIAWKEFSAGRAQTPAEVDANYVRRSDAELLWKE